MSFSPDIAIESRSISRRLMSMLAVIILFVSVIATTAMYRVVSLAAINALEHKADQSLQYLAGSLEPVLWAGDDNGVRAVGQAVSLDDAIVRLIIRNESGAVIYSLKKPSGSELTNRSVKIFHRQWGEEKLAGEVSLSLERRILKEGDRRLLLFSVALILIILASVAGAAYFFVRNALMKPLRRLNEITNRYAAGIYDASDIVLPYVEFQPLGRALTVMGEKIAEQIGKVRDAEAKYRRIVDTANEGVWVFGPDMLTSFVNARMAEMLGYSATEMIGHPEEEFMFEEDAPDHLRRMENRKRGLREFSERRLRRKDGTAVWALVSATPILDSAREFLGSDALVTDITERRRSEEELRRYKDQLEETVKQRTEELLVARDAAEAANKAKSVFLATMSHELRTPLNSILGFSNLMRREPEISASQRERLDIINRSGEHLLTLINDILDISKIESGELQLEEAPVNIHQEIQEILSMMNVRAREKGLNFRVRQSDDFPRCVNVDPGKLRQILINLIGNGIKFTDAGGIILRAGIAEGGGGAVRLRFEVEDTGPGIRTEEAERIFCPFEQLKRVPAAEAGTGLGLTICKQYVKLMGGVIGVTSEFGKGSVFYFEIPVTVLPEDAIPAVPRRGRVIGIEGARPDHRILIVEDEPEGRLLLHKLLEPWGFNLRDAANGKEAVEIFDDWRPDLIWMDIRMPVMDGTEATRRIRRAEGGAQTKVVALTAHALEEERAEIMGAGCDGLVRKPYREHEIFEAITKYLGVVFLYAGEEVPAVEEQPPRLTTDQLCGLPKEMTDELLKAAELLDGPRILKVIGRIAERDKELGEVLRRMAESLQYKELLTVLDTVAEKRAA